MEPKIIKKKRMALAGLWGDGKMTAALWQDFEEKAEKSGFVAADSCGWEIRINGKSENDCFVGFATGEKAPEGFQAVTLPPRNTRRST